MGTHGGGRGNDDLWGPRGDPVRTPQGPMETPWGPMGGAMGTHGDITRTHEGSPIVYCLIERTRTIQTNKHLRALPELLNVRCQRLAPRAQHPV